METIIIRYAELGLKGKNRIFFERILAKNIKDCLKKNDCKHDRVERIWGRIIVQGCKGCDALKDVFGIASYSRVYVAEPDIDKIKKGVDKIIADLNKDMSFRMSVKRQNKEFAMKSGDIERELGSYVVEKTGAKVNLTKYDMEINVEIMSDRAFVFSEKIDGPGGLPVGSCGKVICLVEDEKDMLAGVLMMKRGCVIYPIGSKEADVSLLKKYEYGQNMEFKVMDLQLVRDYAAENEIFFAVCGQTLDDFSELNLGLEVLRPLIAYDKNMIENELESMKE